MCQFGYRLRRQLMTNSNNFVIFDKNKLILGYFPVPFRWLYSPFAYLMYANVVKGRKDSAQIMVLY